MQTVLKLCSDTTALIWLCSPSFRARPKRRRARYRQAAMKSESWTPCMLRQKLSLWPFCFHLTNVPFEEWQPFCQTLKEASSKRAVTGGGRILELKKAVWQAPWHRHLYLDSSLISWRFWDYHFLFIQSSFQLEVRQVVSTSSLCGSSATKIDEKQTR